MSLKTLKDFNVECENQVAQSVLVERHYDLRQEAIKWIKHDIEIYRNADLGLPKGEQGMKIHNFIVQVRQFWKDRFNITEEELKC